MDMVKRVLARQTCLIGSEWTVADSGQTVAVDNPATGENIGRVPLCSKDETARAIAMAREAFGAWGACTALDRADRMLRWHNLILKHQEDLAHLMTLEQGKPLGEARGEIVYGAGFLRWFAEEARRAYGEVIPSPAANKRIFVTKEPVGVVGIITPWNFPMAMIARKVAPALAVGCTAVIKPDEQTPFSALAMADLALEAGIPAGVLNVVTGDPRGIGEELTTNPTVRKVSFTGSTKVGKILLRQCADTVKKVSMELGGNAPFIVFDDADLKSAVAGAVACKFRNSGQTCVCANRFYVQTGIYDAFVEHFACAVAALGVGNGLDNGVSQGPLINTRAVQHVAQQVQDATAKGGRVLVGGKPHALGGNFFEPTVVVDATADMAFAQDETFGPLAPVFRFTHEAEAVTQANNTRYGLAAYVYTKDVHRAFRMSESLEYGLVGVNESLISTCEAPFGGFKESGLGREGSRHGLDEYTECKYICMGMDA